MGKLHRCPCTTAANHNIYEALLHLCSNKGGLVIKTYPEQLQSLAETAGIELKDAFHRAGVPSSTYYRSVKGTRAMTYETAVKVADAITQFQHT